MWTDREPAREGRFFVGPSRPSDTKVLLALDDEPLREELHGMLDAEDGVSVLGVCAAGEVATVLERVAPDVVVLDTDPRPAGGRSLLTAIRTAAARVRVIVVSDVRDPLAVLETIAAGGSGYVLRGAAMARLARAVHDVVEGRFPVDPELTKLARARLAAGARADEPERGAGAKLTPRERTVLPLVAQGLTNAEIAAELVLSPGTVKLHVQHIIAKLGVANRTQAAVYAARNDLV